MVVKTYIVNVREKGEVFEYDKDCKSVSFQIIFSTLRKRKCLQLTLNLSYEKEFKIHPVWEILEILQTLYTKSKIHIPLMRCNLSNTFEYLCDLYIFMKDKRQNDRPTDMFTENREIKKF